MAAAADHDGLRESYDELPYRDRAFEFMHPNALARTAILAGLDAPPIEGCRVLELGCAAGANLMAMAEGLPGATFVGIDLSPRQIEAGRRTAESLGLTNVRLEAMSIVDLTPDFGQFDYILCHGVYSWVPPEVQARILEVCRDNLATQGLACVSYNTYPGWHARGSVREMMLYHVDPDATPALRVRQARQMIEALAAIAAQTHQSERSPLKAIREELELVRDAEDDYIFHELLETYNEPLYFHQFVDRIAGQRLRHVGNASSARLVSQVSGLIDRMQPPIFGTGDDVVRREQYADFVAGRTFRASVICHAGNVPTAAVDPVAALSRLSVLGTFFVAQEQPADAPPGATTFVDMHGTRLTVGDPIMQNTLLALEDASPDPVPFPALCEEVARRLGAPAGMTLAPHDREPLARALIRSHDAGAVWLFLRVPRRGDGRAARPVASRFARLRVAAGDEHPTNGLHLLIALPEFDLLVLPLLDGTRDRAVLVAGVREALLARAAAGRPLEPPPAEEALPELIEQSLQRLAQNWLLVAADGDAS